MEKSKWKSEEQAGGGSSEALLETAHIVEFIAVLTARATYDLDVLGALPSFIISSKTNCSKSPD